MSIFKLNPLDIENFALQVNPNTHYISSSSGITGAIRIFPRNSHVVRDDAVYTATTSSAFSDNTTVNGSLEKLEQAALKNQGVAGAVSDFLSSVHSLTQFDP